MSKLLSLILMALIPCLIFPGDVISLSEPRNFQHSFPENYFRIKVTTTINQLVIRHEKPWDYRKSVRYSKSNSADTYTVIRIHVKKLKAKNKLIQKKFYRMIKARENPYIIIKLPKKQFVQGLQQDDKKLIIPTYLTFAGETQKSILSIQTRSVNDDNYFISGSKEINLYDFNLEPPQKLGGAIKVKSEVMINFGLYIRYVDDN